MKNLITAFFLLIYSFSYSQSASIKGQVLDANNVPLEFANVLLLSAEDSTLVRGAITEGEGFYSFSNIETGSYLIESSLVGFGSATSVIFELQGNTERLIDNLILTNGISIDEITVVAEKPFIELKADKMVVNVANSSVNAGDSALEVLAKSPGVSLDNNNNIILRGRQGVLVTINGKNQYLSGDEVVRLLETMPSANIETIEIITNPSAKYDAEGNTGIINITLKKNENLGTNGNISTSLRQGINTSHFHNLNLNNRTEKLNVYGHAEYYNWGWSQELSLRRDIAFENGNTMFDQFSDMRETGDGYNAKLGVDWDVFNNGTFGVLYKRNEGDEQDYNDNFTSIVGDNMPNFDKLSVDSDGDGNYLSTTYNVNYAHKIGANGSKLTLDADWGNYNNHDSFIYKNYFLDNMDQQVLDPYFLRNNQLIGIDIFATTADLVLPINDQINFETGVKYSSVETEANTRFESQESSGNWINEVQRTNDFMYSEDVYAAYINSQFNFSEILIQGGLRMEHTNSEGISMTTGSVVPRKYTNFFPSISLSKQFGEDQNLSLSYSRRLERPNYKNLNPFEQYLDQYTFQKGNPFLNPQYANSLGLNYALGNKLFVSANYSHTVDAITEIIEQNSATNTTFQTNDNIADTHSASLTLSAPKVWSEKITSRMNATGFYNNFKSVLNDGELLDNNSFGAQFSLNNEIKLPGDINMEVNGRYQTEMVYGQLTISPQGRLDFGFSKRIFKGKGQLRLSISDVFRTSNSDVFINQNGVNLYVDQLNDTRRGTLKFSYSFGNEKVKKARQRQTSSSDESNRI